MLAAIIYGLIQGLTEFLPVSSSGHLVVIPAFLSKMGFQIDAPSLAVSAVLHLGTLIAVLVYYRRDVIKVLRLGRDPEGKKIALLVGVGTIPALIGLPLASQIEQFQKTVSHVGWALVITGLVLVAGQRLATGARSMLDGRVPDAILIGLAQAIALLAGISRSGMTISAGNGRRFDPTEAARFSFLLGIPAIAGAGLTQFLKLENGGGLSGDVFVGMTVAAVSGYAAIALLLAALRRVGLMPFAFYCLAIGALTIVVL